MGWEATALAENHLALSANPLPVRPAQRPHNMADENNAAGAPSGDTGGALSLDQAVEILGPDEKREPAAGRVRDDKGRFVGEEPAAETDETEEVAASTDEPAQEAEPSDEDENPPETQEAEGEPETDDEPEVFVDGKAKTRLRDGTAVEVGALKKAYDELQDIKAKGSQPSAEVEQLKAEVQQRKEYLDQLLPHAVRVLQANIPPEPDDALWEADPVEAMIQQRKHDAAVKNFQGVKQAQEKEQAELQSKQAKEFDDFIKEQQTKLVEKRPELKDPEKAKAFYGEFVKVGKELGFSEQELDNTHDHRLIVGVMSLAEKAAKWDKLQASKPKVVEKAKDAIPVQQPGRRAQPSERRVAETEELSKRLSRTGSLDDAAALIGKLGL